MARPQAGKIDDNLHTLIADLNEAGFRTVSSCQGRTSVDDVLHGRHYDHAFIAFADRRVLLKRRKQARALGLHVYNGGLSISSLSGRETNLETNFDKNRAFPT